MSRFFPPVLLLASTIWLFSTVALNHVPPPNRFTQLAGAPATFSPPWWPATPRPPNYVSWDAAPTDHGICAPVGLGEGGNSELCSDAPRRWQCVGRLWRQVRYVAPQAWVVHVRTVTGHLVYVPAHPEWSGCAFITAP